MSEHYFTPSPTGPEERHTVRFTVAGQAYALTSSRGVFSADRLDPGTAVLLREAPAPALAPAEVSRDGTTLLDLGCGYGPIAITVARRAPTATVWAVDVNERARALTVTNAAAYGVSDRVHVAAPEDVPDDLRFDEIWSNPPIRIGKPALHALLEQWLARLADEGTAWLVVARNLGADSLARWLGEVGYEVRRHASSKGYRVLAVRRERR